MQQRSSLSSAFDSVVSIIPSFLNSSVSAHRIRELVELPKETHIEASHELKALAEDGFQICMENVSFNYSEDKKVIKDSNFFAAPERLWRWLVHQRRKDNDDSLDSGINSPTDGTSTDQSI